MKRQRTIFESFDCVSRPTSSEGATKHAKGDSCDREAQQNTINVDQPIGATTIIVNSCAPVVPTDSELPDSSRREASQQKHGSSSLSMDYAPSDLAPSPDHPPCQPNIRVPTTLVGGNQRCFNPEWYKSYSWLEYSVQKDAAFCYPCRLFTSTVGRSHNTFTTVGYRDWKHATGKGGILNVHDKCSTHLDAMVAWST